MKIKAFSYNVHKLFNITGRKYFLSSLKDILSEMDIDLVFLQELPGLIHKKYEKDYDKDPLEHLADQLWDHYVYGKNAIYTNRNHGNAILSKYPFVYYENFDISNHQLEQRGFLLGKIEIKGQPIVLGSTHLDLTSIGRTQQLKKIENILLQHCAGESPLLICGDFNDWNGRVTKKMKAFQLETKTTGPTFPSFFPLLSLDRIFCRNMVLKKVEVLNDARWKKLSDHLPMYVEFETTEHNE